jgi:hypothetical protein
MNRLRSKLLRACLRIAGALGMTIVIGGSALADDATRINLAPLFNEILLPIAGAVGAALAAWIVAKLLKLIGLQSDEKMRDTIDHVLANALAYGVAKAGAAVGDNLTVDVKNAAIKSAADYALAHAPETLAHFGVTPELLAAKLAARLALAQPAAAATTA